MSTKKNQKSYNKDVMRTGREANQYMRNALGLINQYTTDYAGRNDFWLDRLNDRQLNLLSDKYLAENANMLRGSGAFGSNSGLNRQIENNAYSQQNYLANVANENVMRANQLQQNELSSLFNASSAYQNPINMGATAAANVDAANNAWMAPAGSLLKGAGAVASFFPGVGTAIGAGLGMAGSALSEMGGQTQDYQTKEGNMYNRVADYGAQLGQGLSGTFKTLSTQNKNKVDSNFSIG